MKYINKAFTLMELMVVIAIVTILAAVAIPVYKRYLISARMSSVVQAIEGLLDQMIAYANVNGYFPTAGQLGLNAANSSIQVSAPSIINPYVTAITVRDTSNPPNCPNACPCGQFGSLVVALANTAPLGFATNISTSIDCNLWRYNGVINTLCAYRIINTSASYAVTGQYIPGWNNIYSTRNYGTIKFNQEMANNTSSDATCIQ